MSNFQRYNVSATDLWNHVTESLGENPSEAWARVRSVHSIVNGDAKHILTIINTRQPERVPRTESSYEAARFVEDSVRGDALLSSFHGSGDAFKLSIAGLTIPVSCNGSTRMESSDNVYTGRLPCHLVDLSSKDQVGASDWSSPLLRHALPPFDSLEDALGTWISLEAFLGRSDARLGHVLVALPIEGPRFGAMALRDGALTVQIEELPRIPNLELKVVIRNGAERKRNSLVVSSATTRVDVSEAESVQIWLIDADSRVRDYFSETSSQCSRQHRLLYPGTSTGRKEVEVLESIRRGESDRMEFKPFIEPSDPRKVDELVRTAIAFANTRGGDILLGVTDLQEAVGIGDDALRAEQRSTRRTTARSAIAHYCCVLRKLLSDRSSPHLEATITPINVAERIIVRIRVADGKQAPYTDAVKHDLWIRRGANSVRPIGAEIEGLVQRKAEALELLRGRRWR